MEPIYLERYWLWSLKNGRMVQEFRDYNEAVKHFGSDGAFERHLTKNNLEASYVMVKQS